MPNDLTEARGQGAAGGAAVVIPAYNYGRFVAEAIRSAAAQGDSVSEIVVVDDGSTDNTREVASGIAEPRLRLLTQPNRGLSAARNTGWRAAKAEWIQFLDADDRLAPGAIACLLEAARKEPERIPFGVQAIYGAEFEGEPFATGRLAERGGYLYDELSVYYHANLQTALMPRRVIEALGGYNEAVRIGEDYDLLIRLARRHEFVYVPQVTYWSRMHGQNLHVQGAKAALDVYLETIRRNLGHEPGLEAWWRYRRAMAHWLWYFGEKALQMGDGGAARRRFAKALLYHPLKLGAWRGWWRSLRRGGQPKPAAPS